MKYNPLIAALSLAVAIACGAAPAAGQEAARTRAQAAAPSYEPAGRRDPFKDLLGGQAVKESRPTGGPADLRVEDLQIIGIIKAKGSYRALIAVTDGFPLTAREGDRFADGYVLSIRDGEVVFRKTQERGIPLPKPRDIVREITSEER
jgi:hypothetical protein